MLLSSRLASEKYVARADQKHKSTFIYKLAAKFSLNQYQATKQSEE